MLLDVFWLVCHHTDQRVELDDGDAEIQEVDWVPQKGSECWQKVWKT